MGTKYKLWIGLSLVFLVCTVHCQEIDDDKDHDGDDHDHDGDDDHAGADHDHNRPGDDSSEEKDDDDDGDGHKMWPYIVGGVSVAVLLVIIAVVVATCTIKKKKAMTNAGTQAAAVKKTKVAPQQGFQTPNAPIQDSVVYQEEGCGDNCKANPVGLDEFMRPPDYCDLPPAYDAVHAEHGKVDQAKEGQGVPL